MLICMFLTKLFTIVLSVLLRYTDSDYPFGIFKLFLQIVSRYKTNIVLTNRTTAFGVLGFTWYAHDDKNA